MSGPRFWLIRHAESTWNAAGRWQGQLDPPLSERGREQARRLAGDLVAVGLERLVASSLRRTAETAAILAEGLGLPVQPEPDLRELDAGRWAGRTREEIARSDTEALARFDSGDREAPAGGAECLVQVAQRARARLRAVARESPGARIGVVTHSGVIRALLPGTRLDPARWCEVGACELLEPGAP